MYITPGGLSEKTQGILKAIGIETAFFDSIVDETVCSVRVHLLVYQDGKWVSCGSTGSNLDARNGGRLGLCLTNQGGDIIDFTEYGYVRSGFNLLYDFSDAMLIGTTSWTTV